MRVADIEWSQHSITITRPDTEYDAIEVCAGAGGQAVGLHNAGFGHRALVELDAHACRTLRHNGTKVGWGDRVHEVDLHHWLTDELHPFMKGPSLLAGDVPCPPFSIAGKQLGEDDDRDLFPRMLWLADQLDPRAVMIENVRGLLGVKFDDYRGRITASLQGLGYVPHWKLLNASDYGVSQLRPRTVMVALRPDDAAHFRWPGPIDRHVTVGQLLRDSMASNGWEKADEWASQANDIAPTLVGGSKKHGGADLGPTRARAKWATLGVNGIGVADVVPSPGFVGSPKLTVQQAALVQGFPEWWEIKGRKTAAYRQVGNAFSPPVAEAVGGCIMSAFAASDGSRRGE